LQTTLLIGGFFAYLQQSKKVLDWLCGEQLFKYQRLKFKAAPCWFFAVHQLQSPRGATLEESNMSWKQPIPVTIFEAFGKDHLARDLFIHLLLRARAEDMDDYGYYEGKPYKLKRGQVIMGQNEYAVKLRSSGSNVWRACVRLVNRVDHYKVNKQASYNYSIISILFYDDLTKMNKQLNKQLNKQRISSEQAVNTNKNVRTIEKNIHNKSLFDDMDEKKMFDCARKYQIDIAVVKQYKDNYIGWVEEKPNDKNRQGRVMSKTVQNWLRRDIQNGKITPKTTFEQKINKYMEELNA
jgi:hypothetical protein